MIVCAEQGRLGNQLFQYAALRAVARDGETIALLGFDDLTRVCDGVNARTLPRSGSRVIAGLLGQRHRIDRFIRRAPWPGVIEEGEDGCPRVDGPARLLYVVESYFQSELSVHASRLDDLRVRPDVLARADSFLSESLTSGRPSVFLHVRRGDYLMWPSRAAAAVLPAEWYLRAILNLRDRLDGPTFIVVTDDVPYAVDLFGTLPDVVVSTLDADADFAVMTRCDAGILAASTFSWWGAWFAVRCGSRGPFVAPRYWAGHAGKAWYPRTIESSFLEYQDV